MISISIFVFMTVVLVVKYGNFNQSVLLTNQAYDTALVIRTAQTFGVSVTNAADSSAPSPSFSFPYGVNFSTTALGGSAGVNDSGNTRIILFIDNAATPTGVYSAGISGVKSIYNITRGAVISGLCSGGDLTTCTAKTDLNISFRRPNPEAIICSVSPCNAPDQYAQVTLLGTDGSTRTIAISQNGQVSILQ